MVDQEIGMALQIGGDLVGAGARCRVEGGGVGGRCHGALPLPRYPGDDRLAGLLPVGEEGGEAFVGERMVGELAQHLGRYGSDVGADTRGLDDVNRMADRGDQISVRKLSE